MFSLGGAEDKRQTIRGLLVLFLMVEISEEVDDPPPQKSPPGDASSSAAAASTPAQASAPAPRGGIPPLLTGLLVYVAIVVGRDMFGAWRY